MQLLQFTLIQTFNSTLFTLFVTALDFVSWKDYKAVTAGLKVIYQASTEENALIALNIFCDQWNHQYPKIGESWRAN